MENKSLLKMPFWVHVGLPLVDFVSAQQKDEGIQTLSINWRKTIRKKKTFIDESGVKCVRWGHKSLAMIPIELETQVFDYYHGPTHASISKMNSFKQI